MLFRSLVVDDVLPNVKLLAAKLTREYFNVLTAFNGPDALEMVRKESPDIVLLDVMMPGMDGFETCKRLKSDPATRHIPVVLVTALDGREDRIRGLDAGADDFVTKPIDDVVLFARVKSLTRLKEVTDELREREESGRRLGVNVEGAARLRGSGGRVLVVDDDAQQQQRMTVELAKEHRPLVEADPEKALAAAAGPIDLMIVDTTSANFDGLRLIAQARSAQGTRKLPILAVVDPLDRPRLVKALELGANDILPRPIDSEELSARVRTQVRRKRYADFLREKLDYSLEMAVTDALTRLHNRRYMESHLSTLAEQAAMRAKPLALMMLDIDYFKSINDNYGHDAGDDVLREFAVRIRKSIRGIDLACRFGGEEFVIVMPETDLHVAGMVAERLRRSIAGEPFSVEKGAKRIEVTISIGISTLETKGEPISTVLKRADQALYRAKHDGRNRVVAAAA